MPSSKKHIVCIGAGPAGLTAAYTLSKAKHAVTVLEGDPNYVGGISRTVDYEGFKIDIGGHRFFSKSEEIENLWDEMLGEKMLIRDRKSRIYYRKQLYAYPIRAIEALTKLGLYESIFCGFSYLRIKLFPFKNPQTFEQWVSNNFGRRLYSIFFKSYTEKVWGMSCTEISADWAAQRIKGFSLGAVILNIFFKPKTANRKTSVKTLIDKFRYPPKGPGMLWEATRDKITQIGGQVLMGEKVTKVKFLGETQGWEVTHINSSGTSHTIQCDEVISTAPLRELIHSLSPQSQVSEVASKLKYRDFITVGLIVKNQNKFDDNWIYIHDPNVKVGRIQNYNSWSPFMSPDPKLCCLGLEYFCFQNDGMWKMSDKELIELAKKEIVQLNLIDSSSIIDGHVIRQEKAYPIYDQNYQTYVDKIKEELESKYSTLHVVGRNGMHKYNNQDHSMMTALLVAKNIIEGKKIYNPWMVNEDALYQETISDEEKASTSGLRLVPMPISSSENPEMPQTQEKIAKTGSRRG